MDEQHKIKQAEDSRLLSLLFFMCELATPAATATTAATGFVTDHVQFHIVHLLSWMIFPREITWACKR